MRWGFIVTVLVACEVEEVAPSGDVSYARVAPILEANCVGCHSDPPSNGAPFSLASFEDAAPRADRIVARAVEGNPSPMPPSGLALSAADELVLIDWADAGAPQ